MKKVPELRFPEFKDEWKEEDISTLVSFHKGRNLSKNDLAEEGIPCILYGELYTKYKEVIKTVHSRTNSEKKLVMSKCNDVLLPSSGETALDISSASVVRLDNVALGGDINVLRPKENIEGRFLSYSLNSAKKRDIAKMAQGNSIVHLYASEVGKVRMNYPSKEEQQKLADFFSTLDSRIEIQEEKINNLEDQKKGYMQRIFSQEIRFKDENGEDYPEWEEKRLGETNIYVSDGNYGEQYPKINQFVQEGIPFLRANNIINNLIDLNDVRYITNELHRTLTSGHLLVEDIIISTRGEIGKVAIIPKELEGSNINAQLCLLRVVSSEIIKPKYLYHYLFTPKVQKRALELKTGTALKQLPKGNLAKIEIVIPTIEEQQKISDFLSLFDEKIQIERKILETLQEMKRGFLQKMFV